VYVSVMGFKSLQLTSAALLTGSLMLILPCLSVLLVFYFRISRKLQDVTV